MFCSILFWISCIVRMWSPVWTNNRGIKKVDWRITTRPPSPQNSKNQRQKGNFWNPNKKSMNFLWSLTVVLVIYMSISFKNFVKFCKYTQKCLPGTNPYALNFENDEMNAKGLNNLSVSVHSYLIQNVKRLLIRRWIFWNFKKINVKPWCVSS